MCAWARGVGFGYFAGMVSVINGVCTFTPLGVFTTTCGHYALVRSRPLRRSFHSPINCSRGKTKTRHPLSLWVINLRREPALLWLRLDTLFRQESWTCLSELPWGWVGAREPLNIIPRGGRRRRPRGGRRCPGPPPQGGFGKFHYESPIRTMSFDYVAAAVAAPVPLGGRQAPAVQVSGVHA